MTTLLAERIVDDQYNRAVLEDPTTPPDTKQLLLACHDEVRRYSSDDPALWERATLTLAQLRAVREQCEAGIIGSREDRLRTRELLAACSHDELLAVFSILRSVAIAGEHIAIRHSNMEGD